MEFEICGFGGCKMDEFSDWDETPTSKVTWTDEALEKIVVKESSNSILSPEKTRRYYSNIRRRAEGLDVELESDPTISLGSCQVETRLSG